LRLSPDGARCTMKNSKLLEQVSADIRTMSYLFSSSFAGQMGLYSAIKWYVEGFAERSKIAANLELAIDGERLPRDHEMCLFRIAQECLTRVVESSGILERARNRTNPNEPNKGVTTRFSVELESNPHIIKGRPLE
jgi:signal transduction histidine kinase